MPAPPPFEPPTVTPLGNIADLLAHTCAGQGGPHMPAPAPNFRIKNLVAVVAVDPADNSEGVCAILRGGIWQPLIAADEARLDSFRQVLPELRRTHKGVIKLVRFSVREDVEIFEPAKGQG